VQAAQRLEQVVLPRVAAALLDGSALAEFVQC
jgi:hypothetical protein